MAKMTLNCKEKRTGYCLIAPLVIGYGVFYLVPFLLIINFSVTKGSMGFVGIENYMAVLQNGSFQLAVGNTIYFLGVSLPLILIISFAIALLLKSKQIPFLKSVMMLPYVMPVVGTTVIIDLLFSETGLLNSVLDFLQLPVQAWLESAYAFWIMLLLFLWKNTGYAVILLLAGLNTIPESQYDAASVDGAGKLDQLRYITIPQMWYSIFFALFFSLINAFKCFREVFLIGGTHPHESIYTLQHFLNNCFDSLNYANLSVASIVLLIPLNAVFILLYRWVMEKEGDKR